MDQDVWNQITAHIAVDLPCRPGKDKELQKWVLMTGNAEVSSGSWPLRLVVANGSWHSVALKAFAETFGRKASAATLGANLVQGGPASAGSGLLLLV